METSNEKSHGDCHHQFTLIERIDYFPTAIFPAHQRYELEFYNRLNSNIKLNKGIIPHTSKSTPSASPPLHPLSAVSSLTKNATVSTTTYTTTTANPAANGQETSSKPPAGATSNPSVVSSDGQANDGTAPSHVATAPESETEKLPYNNPLVGRTV